MSDTAANGMNLKVKELPSLKLMGTCPPLLKHTHGSFITFVEYPKALLPVKRKRIRVKVILNCLAVELLELGTFQKSCHLK